MQLAITVDMPVGITAITDDAFVDPRDDIEQLIADVHRHMERDPLPAGFTATVGAATLTVT